MTVKGHSYKQNSKLTMKIIECKMENRHKVRKRKMIQNKASKAWVLYCRVISLEENKTRRLIKKNSRQRTNNFLNI